MDPKIVAAFGVLSMCCICSSIVAGAMSGEEDPDTGAGAGAGPSAGPSAGETCDETLSGEKDVGYRGCQAQTVTGKTCQRWDLQTPHTHTKVLGEKGVEAGHNYCRNPDGADTIWCYTTDSDKRWESCEPL